MRAHFGDKAEEKKLEMLNIQVVGILFKHILMCYESSFYAKLSSVLGIVLFILVIIYSRSSSPD